MISSGDLPCWMAAHGKSATLVELSLRRGLNDHARPQQHLSRRRLLVGKVNS